MVITLACVEKPTIDPNFLNQFKICTCDTVYSLQIIKWN